MLMAKVDLIAVHTDLEKENWDPAGNFLESKRNTELKEVRNSPIYQAGKKVQGKISASIRENMRTMVMITISDIHSVLFLSRREK